MTEPFGPEFSDSAIMTSDLIRETRGHLSGSASEQQNALDQDFAADSDTLVTKYPLTGVQAGQSVEVGWVTYTIVDVDTAAKTLSVLPEIEGTSVAAVAGTRIRLRPRYTARRIIDQLNNELAELSGQGLYRIDTADALDGVVTLPVGTLVVLDTWSNESTSRELPSSFYRITDTDDGPQLRGPATIDHVVLGCAFNPLSTSVDQNVALASGLWPMALDILPMGAAVRLASGTEAQRNDIFAQGETRRSTEVPPGSFTSVLRNLAGLRQSRIVTEGQRLQQRYGVTKDVAVY